MALKKQGVGKGGLGGRAPLALDWPGGPEGALRGDRGHAPGKRSLKKKT